MEVSRLSGGEEDEEPITVLTEARHLETITAPNTAAHSWRLKERVRMNDFAKSLLVYFYFRGVVLE